MEINGVAHVMLTAGRFEVSREFYGKLLPFLGLKAVIDSDGMYYCVGGRTAIGIMRAHEEHAGERFVQFRTGLHHVCFLVGLAEDDDLGFRRILFEPRNGFQAAHAR